MAWTRGWTVVDEAKIRRDFEDIQRQIRELGPSIADAFAPVVANLQQTIIDTIAATYYTRSQTDIKVASPGAIAPTTVSASGAVSAASAAVSGGVTAATVAATGQVSGATGVFNGGLFSTDAYSFNMTGTRVTGWHQIDGHIGTASSSERFKTNIVDANLIDKAEAILAIEIDYYNYKAEIAKRDDPSSPGYVGAEYQVHQELGAIAERLHEAGLWEFVVYERDTITETRYRDVEVIVVGEDGEERTEVVQEPYTVYLGDTLRLDGDGEPIPFGIHYDLLGIAGIAAAQYLHQLYKAQQQQIDANTEAIAALREHVGLSD